MGLRDRIWALVMGYGPRDLGFKVGIWALRLRIELRGDGHTRKRRRRRRKFPACVKAKVIDPLQGHCPKGKV